MRTSCARCLKCWSARHDRTAESDARWTGRKRRGSGLRPKQRTCDVGCDMKLIQRLFNMDSS
jgi:hypothetical protein